MSGLSKLIYNDDNDNILESLKKQGIPLSSIIDTSTGIKSASSDLVTRNLIEQHRPKDDSQIMVHLVAMGDSDIWGFNKNGDHFSNDALIKYANTFVTNGHVFREHDNTCPSKSIGTIKHAAYDPKGMRRVELLVWLDRDKAQQEFDLIKKGSALSWSMSCKVPWDECSICGNRASRVSNYCDCLKYNLGRYMHEKRAYAYAKNIHPKFFDISHVANPADRVARYLEYIKKDDSDLAKAASSTDVTYVSSTLMAKAAGVNLDNRLSLNELIILEKLCEAETMYKSACEDGSINYKESSIYPFALKQNFTTKEASVVKQASPSVFFRKMANSKSIMSFPAWVNYAFDMDSSSPEFKKASALYLPGIFNFIKESGCCDVPFMDMVSAGYDTPDPIDVVMKDLEEKFSTEEEKVHSNVIHIMIDIDMDKLKNNKNKKETIKKEASAITCDDGLAKQMATSYANYQIQAISDIQSLHTNNVNPNIFNLLVSANSAINV